MADADVAGLTLLLILPLVVFDGVSATRAGFDAAFWRRPLEEKLPHIVDHPRVWIGMGAVWPPLLVLVCAGMAAFSLQLADAGSGTWAFLALGAYLVGAFTWLLGVLIQTPVVLSAARERDTTGETPTWLEGLWNGAWWAELTYVLAANVAFVAWGVGILEVGYPARWMGWTMVVFGSLTVAWAAATRSVFPQLGLLLPFVLGIALVLS